MFIDEPCICQATGDSFVPEKFANGTIVMLSPTKEFQDYIAKGLSYFCVPRALDPKLMHQTVVYAKGQYSTELVADAKKLLNGRIALQSPRLITFTGHKGENILAIEFASPALVHLFNNIVGTYKLKHSFPTLKYHITVSYDCDKDWVSSDNFVMFNNWLANSPEYKRADFGFDICEVAAIDKNFDETEYFQDVINGNASGINGIIASKTSMFGVIS